MGQKEKVLLPNRVLEIRQVIIFDPQPPFATSSSISLQTSRKRLKTHRRVLAGNSLKAPHRSNPKAVGKICQLLHLEGLIGNRKAWPSSFATCNRSALFETDVSCKALRPFTEFRSFCQKQSPNAKTVLIGCL